MRGRTILWGIVVLIVGIFAFLLFIGSYVAASPYAVTLPNDAFWTAALVALGVIALLLVPSIMLARRRKRQLAASAHDQGDEPIDHRAWARSLLARARDEFSRGEQKEAHGSIAEALRFFYVHELGLDGQLPSTDLIRALDEHQVDSSVVSECLEQCTMVEFARARPKDFEDLVRKAEHIVGSEDLSKL